MKNMTRNELKVGMEVVINGVWYIVTEIPTFGAYVWCMDADGGEKEFAIAGICAIVGK